MHFHNSALTSLLLLATYGSASPVSQPFQSEHSLAKRGGCGDQTVGPYFIGGSTGTPFCDAALSQGGGIIKEFEVWSDDDGIRGIFFTFTDGHTTMHGDSRGDSKTMTLAAGEVVQLAKTRGNGKGEHVGRIYLKTDKQEFIAGPDNDAEDYNIDVGSGLLMAAAGLEDGGDFLKSLAWIFLKPKITSVNVNSVKYDEDPTGTTKGITADALLEHSFGNPKGSTGNTTFAFSASRKVTKTTTWDQTTKGTFGMKASVEFDAGIPLIGEAKVNVEASWSVEHSTSSGGSESEETTISDTITVSLAPGYGKKCKIVTQHGEGDFPYTSQVQLNLEGGAKLTYSEKGTLKSVQYSEAQGSCVDAANPIDWDADPDHPVEGVKVIQKPEKVGQR